jgi:Peptidase A4 family
MRRNISLRISKKLIAWHSLMIGAPAMLAVVVFGIVVYGQSLPTQPPAQPHKVTAHKSITHTAPAPAKAAPPAPAVPPTPVAPPVVAPAAPAKKVVQAGTPKAQPVVTPAPNSNVSGLTPTTPAPASPQTPGPQVTTGYLSTNWSGYLAVNANFTSVSGAWIATNPTGNGSTTTADSTWIGIGGVTSGDLIQVGTQNIINATGRVSTSAFYELLPNVSQPVPGVSVSPGDSLSATIIQTSAGQWTITITDRTDGQSATLNVSYASSLSSAEWIEEDPSFVSGRQVPFDNFHLAVFSAGSTVANGISLTIAASTAQPVTMVDSSGQPIAVPSVIGSDGASFTVTP